MLCDTYVIKRRIITLPNPPWVLDAKFPRANKKKSFPKFLGRGKVLITNLRCEGKHITAGGNLHTAGPFLKCDIVFLIPFQINYLVSLPVISIPEFIASQR